ncbi:hypothetical protein F4678DRAFT_444140 [Xylaria arbuscula]|nr:hypothetical protein F4678DRAFT_444140 [Xylaria arbuscula]
MRTPRVGWMQLARVAFRPCVGCSPVDPSATGASAKRVDRMTTAEGELDFFSLIPSFIWYMVDGTSQQSCGWIEGIGAMAPML